MSPTARSIAASILLTGSAFSISCVRRERDLSESRTPIVVDKAFARININTATAEQLEMLPGVGKEFAQRIVEHREKYGPFRRPEHLIMVRGFSDKRFRAVRDLIAVE